MFDYVCCYPWSPLLVALNWSTLGTRAALNNSLTICMSMPGHFFLVLILLPLGNRAALNITLSITVITPGHILLKL